MTNPPRLHPIRTILVADDDSESRYLLVATLASEGYLVEEARTGREALVKARTNPPDLIVSDILMPEMDGFTLCREIRRDPVLHRVPFLFYTATYTDERDQELALRIGADRFLCKPQDPDRFLAEVRQMVSTVRERAPGEPSPPDGDPGTLRLYSERLVAKLEKRTLDLKRERDERRRAEEELELFRDLVDRSTDAYFVVDPETGRFLDANGSFAETLGFSREELLGMRVMDIEARLPDPGAWRRHVAEVRRKGAMRLEGLHRAKDGGSVPVEVNVRCLTLRGKEYLVAVARDLRERIEAERAMRESEERYRTLLEEIGEVVYATDERGTFRFLSPAVLAVTGYRPDEGVGRTFLDFVHEEDRERILRRYREIPTWIGDPEEFRILTRGGKVRWIRATSRAVREGGRITGYRGIFRDITEEKSLEEQLRHSQKMETVGRLAGGVAHDFNNMLSVILGYADLLLLRTEEGHPARKPLEEISRAAQRSMELTRQLLAFARKQVIAPKVIDLNLKVAGLMDMLGRMAGENIELVFRPGADAGRIHVDPSQIDQVLANLVVNARDAIEGQGTVTVETGRAILDEEYCALHVDTLPGEYAILAVSDTGPGMERHILDRIFDPFFTTKEAGKGTGLGLATVYGIVRQNGGNIHVYSEPGRGTTFRIYFPASHGEIENEPDADPAALTGTETILLVEDEEQILRLAEKVLTGYGYRVLAARSPDEALARESAFGEPIHLLLTDVVMPGMDGKTLADRLRGKRPGLETLFMSGYTADVISRQGVLEPGIAYLQKPFSPKQLAARVRETLDRRGGSQGRPDRHSREDSP
ncbi:MAG: hypothetical protein Kow00128_02320 [Deltaproteobacteria bacterium]